VANYVKHLARKKDDGCRSSKICLALDFMKYVILSLRVRVVMWLEAGTLSWQPWFDYRPVKPQKKDLKISLKSCFK